MIYGAKIGIISESAKLFHAVLQETVQFLVQSTHNCCHKVLSFNNFVLPTLCHFATLPHCHIKHLAMWEGWEAERYYKYIIIIYLYIEGCGSRSTLMWQCGIVAKWQVAIWQCGGPSGHTAKTTDRPGRTRKQRPTARAGQENNDRPSDDVMAGKANEDSMQGGWE